MTSTQTIVLHACCGPCASGAIPRLLKENYQPLVYFSNSNIDSLEEFEKRRDAAAYLCKEWEIPFFEDQYRHKDWLKAIKGYESEPEKGARCSLCFSYNLKRTAAFAEKKGISLFTTTLTISPHKNSKLIFATGEKLGDNTTQFFAMDFKKKDGFKMSIDNSRSLELYRQNYCGCEFSRRD